MGAADALEQTSSTKMPMISPRFKAFDFMDPPVSVPGQKGISYAIPRVPVNLSAKSCTRNPGV
ncbi:MAG: hypothetical protein D3926_24020 [Desulfobacteraceae bacterium]|nr:MAG: hypothetical protein D3926_24020 [Desulfobacteraceae bacterium]